MELTKKAPWHLWVIGVLSLLWNLGGVASYLATELGQLEQMEITPEQLDYFYSFPAWAVAFWALGVWGSALGSLLLLLRKKLAVWSFGISIIGLFGTTYYERMVAAVPESLQSPGQNLFAAAIWVITFSLFIYARRMAAKGVLT
ncbi:hypothetical protein [Allopontixanthobacter sp.]|uniref:hypothetical protein n=1 Tax=Allopontixanthobacter sp. TaxID=2906452 RepID=UPI002AB93646|nr:hypothetical protein [Allopontixanthobacter sp.]MDZ4307827.1 hypothetical protein [Allopontixanthobacter sp.]